MTDLNRIENSNNNLSLTKTELQPSEDFNPGQEKLMSKNESPRSSKLLRYLSLTGLAIVSFLFFLYLSFPFGVLKETIASILSKQTGYSVSMSRLNPSLLIGIKAEQLRIMSPGGQSFNVQEISININVLSLFMGNLSAKVQATDKSGGSVNAKVILGLFDLLKQDVIPKEVQLSAKSFQLDSLLTFLLGDLANKPNMVLFADMLRKMGVQASLNAKVDFDIAKSNPMDSEGTAVLSFDRMILDINDPNLKIQAQNFKKAQFKLDVAGGNVQIAEDSGFQSEEMLFGAKGKVKLKPNFQESMGELFFQIKLDGELATNFGFLLNAVTPLAKNGEINFRLIGPVSGMQVEFI